jgi:hypothetical protein
VLSPEDQPSSEAAAIPSNTASGGSPPPTAYNLSRNFMQSSGVVNLRHSNNLCFSALITSYLVYLYISLMK